MDAAHLSFLELIKVIHDTAGAAFAKGALIKTGISAASKMPPVEFENLDAFLNSIAEVKNPIAEFEGKAKHYGEGLFGLPQCPFADSIKTYTAAAGGLPGEYKAVTEQLNRPSAITEKLRVGQGAAVSPFCGVHQPIRSALADRVKIGGEGILIYQLGCKSGSGVKGFADTLIQEAGVDKATVDKILDENMCCYCIRSGN